MGIVEDVVAGYASEGPALDLGTLVVDGEPVPEAVVRLPLSVLNRHGLVAGATGTGKTRTLQLMAERLSAAGVATFVADVKGDLSGLAVPGEAGEKLLRRTESMRQAWTATGYPVEFLALGGRGQGVPVRASLSAFGPVLLSKVLGLNDVQTSSLGLVFHWADQAGLPLLDLEDLRAVVQHLTSDEGGDDLKELGGLARSTAGVILRELVAFAGSGADAFFGEPEFDTADLLRTADDGRGVISCLELPSVADQPVLFSTFLMWLLADLFATLPEVGDLDVPKLVFFFDEAHLLFRDASKDFLAQVAQTVRLIRSKGVGVVFVTQTPDDVPREVLGQLGSRVQHALRAFTPEDAKALRATASTYPTSEHYDLEELLTSVGTGEAVVTLLSEDGAPTPVAWTRIYAPQASMSPAPEAEIAARVQASPLLAEYGQAVDRDSAYEMLARRMDVDEEPAVAPAPVPNPSSEPHRAPDPNPTRRPAPAELTAVEKVLESPAFRSMMRSAATVIGREITRSVLGVGRRRRR
ncbi:MAG: helicase HerA-like domain-containing protein [Actinomycetes bacterium]